MGTTPPRLGEPLADEETVYRAFSAEGYRKRGSGSGKVRPKAFSRPIDHVDGISVARTPEEAVSGLERNFGYCSINVGQIHRLPYGIEVRPDLDDPGHLLLCNIPAINGTDSEREMATVIAGVLSRLAVCESCDHFPSKKSEDLPQLFPKDPATRS